MPNYSISINSKFQPFSFERYIQPYQIYGEAYREQQDALANLEEKASIWENMANSQTDPKAYSTYKGYADDLRAQATNLATEGLNPTSRAKMLDLRARYNKEIAPIQVAYDRRRALADEQRKLSTADQSLRFDRNYKDTSLDYLIANPEASYSLLSGNDITKRTAEMAAPLAKTITDLGYDNAFDSQYIQQRIQYGYPIEEILKEITGKEDASNELRAIRNTIKKEFADNPAYDDAWADAYITRGLFNAIGESRLDKVADGDYIDAEAKASIDLAEKRFNAEYMPDPDNPGYYKPRNKTEDNLVQLDNGYIYDTKTKIIYNEEGKVVTGTDGTPAKADKFTPSEALQLKAIDHLANNPIAFKRNIFGRTWKEGDLNDVSTSSGELVQIDMSTLNQSKIQKIKDALEKPPYKGNLTVDDVDIYVDRDYFSADEYIMVPKGYTPIFNNGWRGIPSTVTAKPTKEPAKKEESSDSTNKDPKNTFLD